MNRIAWSFALLLPALAAANPAPIGGPGKALAPLMVKEAASIRMVEETVVISDGKVEELPSFQPRGPPMRAAAVGYEGEYKLENLSKDPVSLRVGFPVLEGGGRAGGSHGALTEFKVEVRGKPVAVAEALEVKATAFGREDLLERGLTKQTLDLLVERKLAAAVDGEPDYLDFTPLAGGGQKIRELLKPLTVPAPQRKLLEEFAAGGPIEEDDFALEARKVWRAFQVTFGPREIVVVRVTYQSIRGWEGMDYRFGYILTTGARWAGKIGRCRIVIRPAPGRTPKDYDVQPAGAKTVGGELILEWKDLEPTRDVLVHSKPR